MQTREGNVKAATKSSKRVCIEVILHYSGDHYDRKRPGRPGPLTYNVWIDGKMNPGVFSDPLIANPQKQIDNAN